MRLDIAVEIVRDQIIITMVDNGVAERGETAGISKFSTIDGIEDF